MTTRRPLVLVGGIEAELPSGDTINDEGTFTPVIAFGGGSTGVTYNASTAGRYTRNGRLVFYELLLILTAKGSSTGNAAIGGLPFTAAAAPQVPGQLMLFNMTAAAIVAPAARVQNATTTILVYNFNGTTSVALTDAAFTNTSIVNLAGHYIV